MKNFCAAKNNGKWWGVMEKLNWYSTKIKVYPNKKIKPPRFYLPSFIVSRAKQLESNKTVKKKRSSKCILFGWGWTLSSSLVLLSFSAYRSWQRCLNMAMHPVISQVSRQVTNNIALFWMNPMARALDNHDSQIGWAIEFNPWSTYN